MPFELPLIGISCDDTCLKVLSYLSISSLLMLVLSVLGIPWLIARLPSDFFLHKPPAPKHTLFCTFKHIIRNLLAIVLLLLGIAMLVLPGQGLLCIVLALSLGELPGKWLLMQRLVKIPTVIALLNWIRKSRGRTPFEL